MLQSRALTFQFKNINKKKIVKSGRRLEKNSRRSRILLSFEPVRREVMQYRKTLSIYIRIHQRLLQILPY